MDPTPQGASTASPRRAAGAADGLTPPPGANAIALGGLFILSAAFLFVSYCWSRALIGGFDVGVGTVLAAIVSTAFASIFLWWLVPLADFAEIVWIHLPADRRTGRAQCPHCGYPHECRSVCSECGLATAPLEPWTMTLRPVKRFAWILLAGLVVGSAAGEAWCRLDEARFVEETARDAARPSTRPRAFPSSFARMTVTADGVYESEAWPTDRRDRAWQPADPALRERGIGWSTRQRRRGETDDAPPTDSPTAE
jgi:hypothetical protein